MTPDAILGRWDAPDPGLRRHVAELEQIALNVYRADPLLAVEHSRQEDSFRTGGYADRQVLELLQNAADALKRRGTRGRVEIHLTGDALYCANEGAPFELAGLDALSHAYLSDKRGDEIGRFGLGFKSVLGVSDRPEVFSRSVSFGFDAERSRVALEAVAPTAAAVPVLRTPFVLDPVARFSTDPVLASLSEWATTIVRLSLDHAPERLAADLLGFPREFLLFATTVDTLRIKVDNSSGSHSVEYRCEVVDEDVVTVRGGAAPPADWLVVTRDHRPSAEALAEVSEAQRRDEVAVSYAVPLDDATALGRFWAHFPLQDVTSTRGIHNAPWRINDDRTNLLDGRFNRELLDVLSDLVVENLPRLSSSDDPARHLDYLPARDREAPNAADRYLAEVVPGKARATRCMPNSDGVLVRPDELQYLDFDTVVGANTFRLAAAVPGRPSDSPHWMCYTNRVRRARIRTLVRTEDARRATRELRPAGWVESLVPHPVDASIEAALEMIFSVTERAVHQQMCAAKLLPDSDGELHRFDETRALFLHGHLHTNTPGLRFVRPSLLTCDGVEPRLRVLGFQDADPTEELRRLAQAATVKWRATEWTAFWLLIDEVPHQDALTVLRDHAAAGLPLKFRCSDGHWDEVGTAVVAGVVQPINRALVVDEAFHAQHLGLLAAVGVGRRPMSSRAMTRDLTFAEYQRLQRDAYSRRHASRGKIRTDDVHFLEADPVGPLHVLRRFVDTGDLASAATWTDELLQVQTSQTWQLRQLGSRTAETDVVPAPHLWAVERYGRLQSSWGPRPVARCLHPGLHRLAALLPVASEVRAGLVRTVASVDDVPSDLWTEVLDRPAPGVDPWLLGEVLACAAAAIGADVPVAVPAAGIESGQCAPSALLLAVDESEVSVLTEQGRPHAAFRSDTDAVTLVDLWGCVLASSILRVDVVTRGASDPVPLLDRFRRLRDLSAPALAGIELVACTDLARQVIGPDGTRSDVVDYLRNGHTVYYCDILSDDDLVGRLVDDFELSVSSTTFARVVTDAQDDRTRLTFATCRATPTVQDKLLVLLPLSVLESALPQGLLDAVRRLGQQIGGPEIADLLLHVHGYNVLIELRRGLAQAGYDPPDQWAGSSPAVAFVRSLGLPREYAGTRNTAREADTTVLGPPDLDPLHDYQDELALQIRDLVIARPDPRRALLFLPTGAGKTRVTVEALSKALLEDGLHGPLLWIAQSDELCEQAAQTWTLVWRAFGDRPLRVCRLWDRNEVAVGDEDSTTVVVATDAKLAVCRENPDYAWLQNAGVVIIDEAHAATGPGMDAVLRWLGISPQRTDRPLLGLTATPFKGRTAEANEKLADRFGSHKLDVLGDDPYGELQRQGVLARVEHRVLTGSTVALRAEEVHQIETYNAVPRTLLDRVGRDEERTHRLLEDIVGLPQDWPVLVFTASVLSAQVLAALLGVRGVAAASVSGSTRTYDRRRSIDAFRRGDIRVLTNCDVLNQGFDAPAVRALYIARPTFSPNAYIQMVGRGLRGPANGGKAECLVVNVADTFDRFGDQLAYHEFDHLWTTPLYGTP